jgi:ribonuclease R
VSKGHKKFFHHKKKHHNAPRSSAKNIPHHRPAHHEHGSAQKVFVDGALQIKGKIGFVLSENPAVSDVLVQGPSLSMAMDGDRVRARVTSLAHDARRSGVIVEVLERAHKTVVGTFQRQGPRAVALVGKEQTVVEILDIHKHAPRVNDVVVVNITRWPTPNKAAGGTLGDILGSRDTPGVDLEEIIRRFELRREFPPEVESEAAAYGGHVPEETWRHGGRELFFDHRVFTIDGADAKDFDDAVSIEVRPDGWRLGVHIADVAQYVLEKTPLDEEARRRGTSVYFTGSVVPMLPFPLSDNLCSLRPDTVRLMLSCVMDLDRDGRVVNHHIVESAIRSSKRFTYDDVENILKGATPDGLDPLIVKDVRTMGELARLLRSKRFGRGSLDFDFPEPYVILAPNGRPVDIRTRERLEAHRLIEEFMLLANETVARHMSDRPFVYRIHETPDPARLEKLKKALQALNAPLPHNADITKPSTLRSVLIKSEGTPLQPIIHLLVLRSLKQAIYSPANKGHYGLASECYTHFTSPIRRYPDLIVHRLIKERLHAQHRDGYWADQLPGICAQTSKSERVAVEAEREFMDIQETRLMEPHVGETFSGSITGVTNFGFFVQLDQFFVEGLVHVTSLGNDYFIFDENRMTLIGRRTGRVFALGTKVKVKLAAANVLKRQLDFQLLGGEFKAKRAPSRSR